MYLTLYIWNSHGKLQKSVHVCEYIELEEDISISGKDSGVFHGKGSLVYVRSLRW